MLDTVALFWSHADKRRARARMHAYARTHVIADSAFTNVRTHPHSHGAGYPERHDHQAQRRRHPHHAPHRADHRPWHPHCALATRVSQAFHTSELHCRGAQAAERPFSRMRSRVQQHSICTGTMSISASRKRTHLSARPVLCATPASNTSISRRLPKNKLPHPLRHSQADAPLWRFKLFVPQIMCFFLGGALGAYSHTKFGDHVLFLPAFFTGT